MENDWKEKLTCAIACSRCERAMAPQDPRILSCYDHNAICMVCKREEEQRPDYEETSKNMIGQCQAESELKQSDPLGYCYSHFYPYRC